MILTQAAPASSGHDIHSRVFGPDTEIPEDPVVSPSFLDSSSTELTPKPPDWCGPHRSRSVLALAPFPRATAQRDND